MRNPLTSIVALASLLLAGTAGAQDAPLRVLASNGMKAVIDTLRPDLERAAGRPLDIDFSTTAAQRQKIEAGETFDVTILTTEAVDALGRAGKVARDSIAPLARAGMHVGVREGAQKPDVSTADGLKRTLLAAKSVTWVGVGASRPHIERMLGALGIERDVQAKLVVASGVEDAIERVASGSVEVVLILASEIHGVQDAGPFPGDLQGYVSFAAGVSNTSKAGTDGAKMILALRAPGRASTYAANHMELVR